MTLDKNTEINILNNLKEEGFKITGYYEYEHVVNIVGDLYRTGIFETPIRISIEIVKTHIDINSVKSFINFSENISAQKTSIFSSLRYEELNLDIQKLISLNRVEYIGGSRLEEYIKDREPSTAEIIEYDNIIEILSSKRLALALPELATKIIPTDINKILEGSKKVWEIFEEAVFRCFSHCLSIETEQLGYKKRFKPVPEGVVLPPMDHYAILYDCKSATESYSMDINDQRAVIEYIDDNKRIIEARHKADLQFFLIIGPRFVGDVKLRRENVYEKTGVILFFLEAKALSNLSLWAFGLSPRLKRIIDLRKILRGDEIIDSSNVEDFMKIFDEENQHRY